MAPKLVVKNTFICAVDEDEPSSPMNEFEPRRRAQTSPDPRSLSQELEALELESLVDDEADLRGTTSTDLEAEHPARVDAGEAQEADTDTEVVAPPAFEGFDLPPMVKRVSSSMMSGTTCAETPMLRRTSTETTTMGATFTETTMMSATSTETPVMGATASATSFAEPILVADLQRRLTNLSPIEARSVAAELRGRVIDAARSPQAHAVLLELVRRLPTEDVAFIAEELYGHGRHIASNIHGHVVVCRLLEFSPEHPRTVALVDEILSSDIESLCCHKFGFSLAISVLSNGPQHQKGRIISALSTHVQRFARHRFASQVLEHALLSLHELRDCERLVSELLRHSGGVTKLACHCFGTHVVRALLSVPSAAKQVHLTILQAEQRLRKDRYGAKLLEDLGLEQPGPGSLVTMTASLFGA